MQIYNQNGFIGARQLQRERDGSRKMKGFNKAWEVGKKYSVSFPIKWLPAYDDNGEIIMIQERDTNGNPIFEEDGETPIMTQQGQWDIVTAGIWGHKVNDMSALGLKSSFIPSLTDIYQGRPVKYTRDERGNVVCDDSGKPIYESCVGDITYQFSAIAPLFIAGQKQSRLDSIYKKQISNEDLRREAIQKIEEEFDTSKNMKAPKPVIGRTFLYASTEVVVVPIDASDKYEPDKAGQYSYEFKSNEKFNAILYLLDDIKFKPRDLTQKWFEVQMTFNGTSNDIKGRAEAGRKATPVGLTPEYTMQHRDPDAFDKIKQLIGCLPSDSDMISRRNYSYDKISEKVIARAIEQYIVLNSELLDSISSEKDEEILLAHASTLMRFDAVKCLTREPLKAKIETSYKEYLAEHPEQAEDLQLITEQEGYAEPAFDDRPSSRELVSEAAQSGILLPEEEETTSDFGGMVL